MVQRRRSPQNSRRSNIINNSSISISLSLSLLKTLLLFSARGGDPEVVRDSIRKRFSDPAIVDKVIELDAAWREGEFFFLLFFFFIFDASTSSSTSSLSVHNSFYRPPLHHHSHAKG
jgi:hypothetical protein